MGIWIEIRCEGRAGNNSGCWSDSNHDPGRMSKETNASLMSVKQELEKDARDAGYKRYKDGWYCPACVSTQAAHKEKKDVC